MARSARERQPSAATMDFQRDHERSAHAWSSLRLIIRRNRVAPFAARPAHRRDVDAPGVRGRTSERANRGRPRAARVGARVCPNPTTARPAIVSARIAFQDRFWRSRPLVLNGAACNPPRFSRGGVRSVFGAAAMRVSSFPSCCCAHPARAAASCGPRPRSRLRLPRPLLPQRASRARWA